MIVRYEGDGRDYEHVFVTFGEYGKFANKVVMLEGWLYRKGGGTIGGGGLPPPKNKEKPTFYISSERSMYWVLSEDDIETRISVIKDDATVKELSSYLISESKNGDSDYYLEEIEGYYGL